MSRSELIDIVDDNDRVIGQAQRWEIRRDHLRHRSVYVLVFNPDGQLFVHRRTRSKDIYPDYWDVAIGGVVTAGEDYDSSARRELQEELGIEQARLRRWFPMRYDDAENHVAGMVYSCTWAGRVRLQQSEISSGEWTDLDVVLERTQHQPFCPDGLEALRLYLSRLATAREGRQR